MPQELAVLFYGTRIGVLRFAHRHYEFKYDEAYLLSAGAMPISLSLPLTSNTYISEQLFPFFNGLLTEGWLKSIQEQIQHLDRRDHFSFLVRNGLDLVGAVTLAPVEEDKI